MSENSSKTILVIGTFDTKNDELFYLSDCIQKQNGNVLTMDVSVLGDPEKECDISKHEVAKAANFTINDIVKCTIFVKNMQDYEKINTEYASFFADSKPARELVEVSRLPKNVNIEMSVIAIK